MKKAGREEEQTHPDGNTSPLDNGQMVYVLDKEGTIPHRPIGIAEVGKDGDKRTVLISFREKKNVKTLVPCDRTRLVSVYNCRPEVPIERGSKVYRRHTDRSLGSLDSLCNKLYSKHNYFIVDNILLLWHPVNIFIILIFPIRFNMSFIYP